MSNTMIGGRAFLSAQEGEKKWRGNCANLAKEELKQFEYAECMRLPLSMKSFANGGYGQIDMGGKSVLDVGGGPTSLLLRCKNVRGKIVDPLPMPTWVKARYAECGIELSETKAEEMQESGFDEVWLYNVLQHVENPAKVVERVKRAGRVVRVFEWINIPADPLHPHSFTEASMTQLFGTQGRIETMDSGVGRGKAYCLVTGDEKEQPTVSTGRPYTFHYLAMPHLPVTKEYSGCAFTQKIHKLTKMMLDKGHHVRLYGVGYTDIQHPNLEFVPVLSVEDVRNEWGDKPPSSDNELGYEWRAEGFRHDISAETAECTKRFRANAIKEINARKASDHFLLLAQGNYHKSVADAVGLKLTAEPGIGYRGSYAPFRAFESSYIQYFTYGSEHPRASMNGNHYDRIIPNYFDLNDFEFNANPDGYLLYMGRIIHRKGISIAIKVADELGMKLKVAGQGEIKDIAGHESPNIELVGYAGAGKRNELMGNAAVALVPTIYLEPFGGVAVEAMLCGTPAVTTNFGAFTDTILHGVSGFRCDTLQDFVSNTRAALSLDRGKVREWAMQYSIESVNEQYEKWWSDLYQWYLSTTVQGIKGWHHLA